MVGCALASRLRILLENFYDIAIARVNLEELFRGSNNYAEFTSGTLLWAMFKYVFVWFRMQDK